MSHNTKKILKRQDEFINLKKVSSILIALILNA